MKEGTVEKAVKRKSPVIEVMKIGEREAEKAEIAEIAEKAEVTETTGESIEKAKT